jgi:hypothetical protein
MFCYTGNDPNMLDFDLSSRAWTIFLAKVRNLLGVDWQLDDDGLDDAFDAFNEELTPEEYVARLTA